MPVMAGVSHNMRKYLSHLKIAILAAFCIVLLQVIVVLIVYLTFPDWQTRANFGDAFGVVSAAFSGLAFAGLIYAILLQREDLALQRLELELTRQELKRTAAAQEQSEIALRTQAEVASTAARLSATNLLIDEYKKEISILHKQAFRANDPRLLRLNELERRISVLIGILDSVYREISKEESQHV